MNNTKITNRHVPANGFHVFKGAYKKDGEYYLKYSGETTLPNIIDGILHDPPCAKADSPAVVLNRFKVRNGFYGPTVSNRYANLDFTTGWFGLDVDESNQYTNLVKHTLFNSVEELRVVWISSSCKGVKAIGHSARLENLTPEEFKAQYTLLCWSFAERYAMKINFDMAMGRCHQPIYVNQDNRAFVR